ncbi:MAG: TfoX/Sxy family protein [Pseudomonadota bacterium]
MQEIADRLRHLLMDDPNISEKKMFGGVCFMLNGNMLCGPVKNGDLMLRVGKDYEDEVRARPHTRPMDFTGKPMKGFVFVDQAGLETEAELKEWVSLARRFVGALPPK